MIQKEMTIAHIVQNYPTTIPVFRSFGMHCLGCPSATGESLEQAAQVHGFDVDRLLSALNESLKN
ncbi:DUF1858 domain-containing protein [Heliorestis acidaminivorans]|uniref:DUF1858 domain-containing protein n=1 Tax=Heliorestis acidaminivorans TaxID=553427 RepID=A0A6I0F8V7_9FIRM|nr:DUF1858 domain-containing protein [Heliorestis acidaminivorans]KAB2953878.1 DUF1858 domain-containing protein [Heliorestis acidaminivorans]